MNDHQLILSVLVNGYHILLECRINSALKDKLHDADLADDTITFAYETQDMVHSIISALHCLGLSLKY